LGSCFGAPKVSHEEAASAEVVSKRWPKAPFSWSFGVFEPT
jgi:hypothetical protein